MSLRRAPAYTPILHGLDVDEMERVFREHAAGLAEAAVEGTAILPAVAIDGKTLRGSFDAFHDRNASRLCRWRRELRVGSAGFAEAMVASGGVPVSDLAAAHAMVLAERAAMLSAESNRRVLDIEIGLGHADDLMGDLWHALETVTPPLNAYGGGKVVELST